jgi:uncharacterized protein YhfF
MEAVAMDRDMIEQYWQAYLATLPAGSPVRSETYVAHHVGDNPGLADELGALIVSGTKTATCSAVWEWEAEGKAIPAVGLHTIVLDGQNQPLCIIKTTDGTITSYNSVDAQCAWEEGEGDRTLETWRAGHWRYFGRTRAQIGKQPIEDMSLVCERFRVIYSRYPGGGFVWNRSGS